MLGGCTAQLETPYDSPDYLTVGRDPLTGAMHRVPEACTGADVEAGTRRLPLGCANALNLQRMVHRADDLQRGQAMGPTLAAPLGRAAQRYLLGEPADSERQREEERQRAAAGLKP